MSETTDRRFYGRRKGRPLRQRQQALVDAALPSLEIAEGEGTLDPRMLFDPPRERVWMEIGFGGGEHLAHQAAMHPDIGFIGSEPYLNGVASLLDHMEQAGLANIRIQPDDVRPLLARLPDASIERLFILFPDPWPKNRHHRRRIVGPETIPEFARILADGGLLRLASDHPGYVEWMLRYLGQDDRFEWTARRPSDWRERPADQIRTRYEAKALAGIPVYLTFERRPR